jgi:hypothetical protein
VASATGRGHAATAAVGAVLGLPGGKELLRRIGVARA